MTRSYTEGLQSSLWGAITRSFEDYKLDLELTETDFRDKDFGNLEPFIGPLQPRPSVTAWEGYKGNAYYHDGSSWRHCISGERWEWRE